MPRARAKQNLAVAVSLAFLAFSPCWTLLSAVFPLFAPINNLYLLPVPFKNSYLSLLSLVLVATLAFWAILEAAARSQHEWVWMGANFLLGTSLFFPLNCLRHDLSIYAPWMAHHFSHIALAVSGLLGVEFLLFLTVQKKQWPVWMLRSFILVALPFSLFKILQSTYSLAVLPVAFSPSLTAETKPVHKTRVVWLLYDEMEQNLAFDNRPNGLPLPNLDRFKSTAFAAQNAYAPADKTLLSLPSYLTGKVVEYAVPKNSHDLLLRFVNSNELKPWSQVESIFGDAKAIGGKTALVGSYHPYCRLNLDLDFCSFFQGRFGFTPEFGKSMKRWVASLFPGLPQLDYQYGLETMEREVIQIATNPNYSFLFVHWPFPHSPWMFDKDQHAFSSNIQDKEQGYSGNLALVDETLGRLRTAMEKAGQWDNTVVIVTSDHWWREYDAMRHRGDHRIPLLIKGAHQTSPLSYKPAVQAMVLHDLVLDALKKEDYDGHAISSFIQNHAEFTAPIAALHQ